MRGNDTLVELTLFILSGHLEVEWRMEATQCVFIEKCYDRASAIPPAPIPNNSNSTRAQSKKNRVFVLREFLLERYPSQMSEGCSVLDVAGGRGDLSFILRNFGGQSSFLRQQRYSQVQCTTKMAANK